MPPVNKILLLKLLTGFFVGICFIVGTIHWFSGIKQQNLNGDEPTWIAMTEMYQHRKNGNWSKFKLDQTVTRKGWGNEINILIDQPQTSKYIFGFVLDVTDSNPWNKQNLNWVYEDFSRRAFPDNLAPQELVDYLGTHLTKAIETIRLFTTTIGWLSILLFSFLIYLYTRNLITVSITFLLTSFNPLLLNYFRKAMTDGLSFFMLLIAGLLFWFGIKKLNQKKYMSVIIIFIAGCTVAISSSIKLNGLFVLLFPFWLFYIMSIFDPQVIRKKFLQIILCLIVFVIGFVLTFCFLEPATWFSPIKSIQALLQTRLAQQESFFYMTKINYAFVPGYAIYIFFRDYKLFVTIPLLASLLLGFATLIRKSFSKNKRIKYTLSVILFIFVTNFYYARTGFDRYLIPTVFTLLFINAIGLTLLITKVQMYVVSKIKYLS